MSLWFPCRRPDRVKGVRLVGLVLLAVWLTACAGRATEPPSTSPTATLGGGEIDAVATVTAASQLPSLSPEEAAPYQAIEALIRNCDAFHPNRRRAVNQHLGWLQSPSQIPANLVTLYGDDVTSQLLFGAAYLVAVEWKLADQPADSCLIPIGQQFNTLLLAAGREAIPEFAEVAQ